MKSTSLGARWFRNQLALLLVFSGTPCLSRVRGPEQDAAFAMEMAKKMRQEAATVELQVTLGGNLKDFSIATGEPSSQTQQSQVSAAVAAYREMLKTDPGNAELHFDLSLALAKLRDSRSAREELETAIRLDRNLAKARNRLGILHMLNNEKAKAEEEFKAAISADSQSVEAKNNLGVLYAWTNKNFEALEVFRLAIQSRPNYPPAHVNFGLVLAAEGNYAEAEKEIRNALRGSPNNPSAYSALGMIAFKRGRGDEAIEILRTVVQIQPGSSFAHLNLGAALSGDGFDLPGALEQFSEAIRLDPKSANAYYSKGRVLYELNRFEESRVELDTACRLQPDYVEALYLLAQVEKKLGNVQRSADVLTHLVTLEPDNADAQLLLGRNLVLLGKMEEAVHHLQIAVAAKPNDEDAFYNLAQALSRMGKPEAKVFLERFQTLKQQREVNDRIQKLGSYGLEAAQARDWPQAVKNFKEAIELCSLCASGADLHRNLGLIYVLEGEVERGRQELETALRIKPDDADARRALESLPNKDKAPD
ncbi:MAG TPA: tetratricopeptide repeat protein [Candidatus Dormibacteraeota bacterium]|nr:tetratricopeptide repeat protein [Candidatus Dormibacteraeota bacterium]